MTAAERAALLDRIGRELVTEAMVDIALRRTWKGRRGKTRRDYAAYLNNVSYRERTRWNIALGIACSSYSGVIYLQVTGRPLPAALSVEARRSQ